MSSSDLPCQRQGRTQHIVGTSLPAVPAGAKRLRNVSIETQLYRLFRHSLSTAHRTSSPLGNLCRRVDLRELASLSFGQGVARIRKCLASVGLDGLFYVQNQASMSGPR
ncbi:hypothetical protein A3839_03320 [Achromobacter insolitus]|nr:hypothetical protein A3839_03320 [Achromobacter insolitus]